MKRLLIILICCFAVFSSCASTKPKTDNTAESKATYLSLKLGLPSPVQGMVEQTNVFLTSDPSVVALVEFEDLKDQIDVRWDWYAPDNLVYLSASRKVGPGVGKYYPEAAVSHSLNVDGEVASTHPGLWQIAFFIDGMLKETRRFQLEPGLTTLQSPWVAADPRKWALVIGVEKYSQLPAVDYATSDARKAANHFSNLLGVPEGQVVLLENEKATRSAVTSRLKDYFPGNLGKDSVFYVYFAGHGMPDVVTGEPYLMFFDSEATNVSRTGYSMKELLSDLGAMDIEQTFLFTDACFSGMAARGEEMLVPGARPAVLRVEDVKVATGKVVAVGASTGSQLSHAYKEKRQGLFTYYLLNGLRGSADDNNDGTVALGELYEYLTKNVERVSRRTTMVQQPAISPRVENVAGLPMTRLPKAGN